VFLIRGSGPTGWDRTIEASSTRFMSSLGGGAAGKNAVFRWVCSMYY
jgi:hypothetical protein